MAKTDQLNKLASLPVYNTFTIDDSRMTPGIPKDEDNFPIKFDYKLTARTNKLKYNARISGQITLHAD